MCCRHPDWFGIPITTPVKITKPPPSVLVPCPDDNDNLIDPNIPDPSDPDPPIIVEPVVPTDPCNPEYPTDGIPENCPGYSVDPIPDPNIPDVSDPDPPIPVEPVDPSPVVPSDPCDVEYPPENCPGYLGPDVDPNPGKGTGPDPFTGTGTCNTNPDFLKCGKRNLDGIGVRIQSQTSADRETQFGEWPHMCAVLNRTKIGKNFIIV